MEVTTLYKTSEEITSQLVEEMDAFLMEHELGNIHQSVGWGRFQAQIKGREKFWIVLVRNRGRIIGMALIIRMIMPGNKNWLMCPRGPVCDYRDPAIFEMIVKECEKIGTEEESVYLRFESPLAESVDSLIKNEFKKSGFKKAHAHHQPESTIMIDLTVSEEEILAQMKSKGRYNVRLAEKKGVKIRSGNKDEDIKEFYNLVDTTTGRNGFSGHSEDFYRNMLEQLGEKRARLYLAEFEGKVISGLIATFYGKVGIYYFGASSNEYRNVMAPYLLQWEAMKEAKSRGCEYYDLFGVAPEGVKNHPWSHITQFKSKFGGERVNYFFAREKVFRPFWYLIMRVVKKVKGR